MIISIILHTQIRSLPFNTILTHGRRSLGALLELEDRIKFNEKLMALAGHPPPCTVLTRTNSILYSHRPIQIKL